MLLKRASQTCQGYCLTGTAVYVGEKAAAARDSAAATTKSAKDTALDNTKGVAGWYAGEKVAAAKNVTVGWICRESC